MTARDSRAVSAPPRRPATAAARQRGASASGVATVRPLPVPAAPRAACFVTGCRRACAILAVLLYLLASSLPLPSVVDLVRDAVDPENRIAEHIIRVLRRPGQPLTGQLPVPGDAGAARLPLNDGVAPGTSGTRPDDAEAESSSHLLLGERLAAAGLSKKHPVVFIPGIISSGLELWQGRRCARRNFRERLWGDTAQANKLLVGVECWLEHMRLDNETGLDPPGVRLRVASGLAAADVVMGAYSLWAGLVQQLAALGYDESSVHLAAYDWRVRFDLLEERDAYFTALKARVELMSDLAGGRPVVFVSHSMGFNVLSYFLQWVHSRAATGRQCPHLPLQERLDRESRHPQLEVDGALPPACDGWWARRYVRTWVNLAGSAAGAPKGLLAWYSGQMGNLASMGPLFSAMLETYLPKRSLRGLWRSFQSMTALIPMGGVRVWGGRSGTGGTRAPFSGWAHNQLPARARSEVSAGDTAVGVRGLDANSEPAQLTSPRVTVAAPVSADSVRRTGIDRSMRWFAAPDEPAANGPATRGIVSLRRVVSWERQDPGAVVEMLLASLGSYLPAVWASGDNNANATVAALGGPAKTTADARPVGLANRDSANGFPGDAAGSRPQADGSDSPGAPGGGGSASGTSGVGSGSAGWKPALPGQLRPHNVGDMGGGHASRDSSAAAGPGARCNSRLGGPLASNSSADSLVGALVRSVTRAVRSDPGAAEGPAPCDTVGGTRATGVGSAAATGDVKGSFSGSNAGREDAGARPDQAGGPARSTGGRFPSMDAVFRRAGFLDTDGDGIVTAEEALLQTARALPWRAETSQAPAPQAAAPTTTTRTIRATAADADRPEAAASAAAPEGVSLNGGGTGVRGNGIPTPGPGVSGGAESRRAADAKPPAVSSTVAGAPGRGSKAAGLLRDFHLSIEELLDVMRVQDPAFMRMIDGYVDLNAWRPPTAPELVVYEKQVPKGAWLRDHDSSATPAADGEGAAGARSATPLRYRPTAGGLPRRLWANALAVPLPDAPGLRVMCMYGVGRAVERHYNMLAVRAAPGTSWEALEDSVAAGNDTIAGADGSEAVPLPVEIATGFSREPEAGVIPSNAAAAADPAGGRPKATPRAATARLPLSGTGWPRGRSSPGRVTSGLTFTDGDGTVPAVSMGLLCERHFRSKQGNPGRASVVTRELPFGSVAGGIDELLRGVPDTVSGELFAESNVTPPIAMAGLRPGGETGPMQEQTAGGGTSEAAQWLEHVSHAGLVRGTVDYIRAQGGQTSEHVDILLNRQVMQTVLMEAAGRTGLAPEDQRLSQRTQATLARATLALEGLTPWDAAEWEGGKEVPGA